MPLRLAGAGLALASTPALAFSKPNNKERTYSEWRHSCMLLSFPAGDVFPDLVFRSVRRCYPLAAALSACCAILGTSLTLRRSAVRQS